MINWTDRAKTNRYTTLGGTHPEGGVMVQFVFVFTLTNL